MADVITIDVNEKPAIDGFENLIDEIVKVDKATDKLEDSGNRAVSTINRIRPAAAQTGQQVSGLTAKIAQLGGELSTGSGKVASFIPDLLKLGPGAQLALAGVGGLAAGLTLLNNTGLKDGKSNLDRLGGAFGDLYNEIGPNINLLKTADDTITGISDTIIDNTSALAENARGWVSWIKGIQDTPGADKFFKRQEEGLKHAREEEKKYADAAKERADAVELAAAKTQQDIEKRRQGLRQERSEVFLNIQSDEERARRLEDISKRRDALEARSLEIERDATQKRAANAKFFADQRIEEEKRVAANYKQQRDIESKAYQESIDFQKRVANDWRDFQRGIETDRRKGTLDTAEAIVRARAEEEKANAERLQGEAREAAIKKSNDELDGSLHALRLKRIKEEMGQKLQATKVADLEAELIAHNATENDAKLNKQTMAAFKNRQEELQRQLKEAQQEQGKIVLEAERQTATAEADFKRQQLVRQIQDRTEAARKQIQVEKDKKAALDGIEKGAAAGVPGFDAAAVLNAQRPQDVRKQLIDRARRDAQAGGGDKRDQAEAARQAAADFAKGKTDPTRLAQAELEAANKTVGAMVAGGKLDNAVAGALANQLRIAAQQQAEADTIKKRVEEIQKVQDALINAGNPSRNRAGAGGQRG